MVAQPLSAGSPGDGELRYILHSLVPAAVLINTIASLFQRPEELRAWGPALVFFFIASQILGLSDRTYFDTFPVWVGRFYPFGSSGPKPVMNPFVIFSAN
jgi:hypothetical protein